jgi:ferritin-like metal-binding protein YciE
MAEKKTVKDLLTDELKDLYSAEKQLTKALPKMASGSKDTSLRMAFVAHLHETTGQVTRLEEISRLLDIKLAGKKCVGMEAVIKEGAEALAAEGDDDLLDLGLIGSGSRVEHYESAGYKMAITLAQRLGAHEVVDLLRATLDEEEAADAKLKEIAVELVSRAPAELAQTAV